MGDNEWESNEWESNASESFEWESFETPAFEAIGGQNEQEAPARAYGRGI